MVYSCYSMLRSTIRIPELAAAAKSLGYSAVALTDRNVMHGAAQFSHACESAGIQPIYGMELDVELEGEQVPFLLLARTNSGFGNLMKLSTAAQCSESPVSFALFRDHLEGVSVIVYGVDGWLESAMIHEQKDVISERLAFLKDNLPPFDVALSYQDSVMWQMKNRMLKECASLLKIRTCAVNKICYLHPDDAKLLQMLKCIRMQRTISDSSVPTVYGRYLLSPQEMEQLYDPDDLARTDEIARSCHAQAVIASTSLPSYPTPENLSSEQYLTRLCLAGLNKRLDNKPNDEYLKRLKYELDTINGMHFSDYFLIVYDFIRYARKSGILVGPGRGSAAGSLVAYCLGITMVDPIRYGLLFERFLNPSRVTMPDIDTDIPDNRREEVIRYVADKYGWDHTANIVTFNTLGAKQVLRDLGKVMTIPQRDIDMLCRMIPNTPKITLRSALEENSRLRSIVRAEERYKNLFRAAAKLEGLPRHTSIHAAGILLSAKPIGEIIPLMNGEDGMVTSQFPAEYMEERGLIKMDFLGLRNLSMIAAMNERIKKQEPSFSLRAIPEYDHETLELFRNADTNGVFQFESDGMKRLLRSIRPDRFEDVVAAMALFRPASTDSIPVYLKNKQNPSLIVYPSEELKPVLEDTYGVMVYQEQSMRTAQIAAGFSLAEADKLRKAMSKKKTEELNAMRGSFVSGCRTNGYTEEQAEHLFDLVQRFGGYGFNKSHAVAYGIIAWQSAYLKAHYPLVFFGCLIDSSVGDNNKISQYIDECRRRRIRILSPDVNASEAGCHTENGCLRLPLSVVKGIGIHAAEGLIEDRNKEPYSDFFDFVARAALRRITKAMLEALIDAGALDCFPETRTTMRTGLDEAISYGELIRIEAGGQITLDENIVSRPSLIKRYDEKEEIREREMAVLGFSLGIHPIIDVRQKLGITLPSLIQLRERIGNISGFAYVASCRNHRTKKGAMMSFVKVNDETGDMDLLVMPSQYETYSDILRRGIYICFDGKMKEDGKCIVNSIRVVH